MDPVPPKPIADFETPSTKGYLRYYTKTNTLGYDQDKPTTQFWTKEFLNKKADLGFIGDRKLYFRNNKKYGLVIRLNQDIQMAISGVTNEVAATQTKIDLKNMNATIPII
jgi:hypothetical protein